MLAHSTPFPMAPPPIVAVVPAIAVPNPDNVTNNLPGVGTTGEDSDLSLHQQVSNEFDQILVMMSTNQQAVSHGPLLCLSGVWVWDFCVSCQAALQSGWNTICKWLKRRSIQRLSQRKSQWNPQESEVVMGMMTMIRMIDWSLQWMEA